MYIIRRTYKTKTGQARKAALLLKKIANIYTESGQRSETIIYYNGGTLPCPINEINRILKKRGKIIGSTPFIYQIHGAPKDYLRFSKDYLFYILKKSKKTIDLKHLKFIGLFAWLSNSKPFCLF